MTQTRTAWGHGLSTRTADGTVLDSWFPRPVLGTPPDMTDEADAADVTLLDPLVRDDEARGVQISRGLVAIDLDAAPTDQLRQHRCGGSEHLGQAHLGEAQ